MTVTPIGVLLLELGGPVDLRAVPAFVRRLLSDPAMVPLPAVLRWPLARWIAWRRAPRVTERYAAIGGGSPLPGEVRRQAAALQQELGQGFLVRYAFRYCAPEIEDVVAGLREAGVERLVAVPAFPQHCGATTGTVLEALRSCADGSVWSSVSWAPDHPTLLALWAALAAPHLPGAEHVLMVAHGLPERHVRRGDPYVAEVQASADALGARLPAGLPWSLAFQSRLGPVAWVRPWLEDELQRLAAKGVRRLVLLPLSFLAENLETCWDLDHAAAALARRCGIEELRRVPCAGSHATLISGWAESVRAEASARTGGVHV